MPIRLYNTLTKSKDEFAPIDAKNVRMYVCGPTVYDFAHIGNARPAIVFDLLFRLLRHEYGAAHVTYARNFTDVDDKINARAAEIVAARGGSVEQARAELTANTEQQYLEDVRALGCLDPNAMPRATEHITGMIAMIARLVEDGFAYAEQGHVLFDVSKKADYGKLARRSLDEMIAGARVDVAPYKRGAMDFVLWKPSDDNTPGWESPWGRGRPGWHIECSAMIADRLGPGQTIDIHGGGIDLVFPHHENEIAQSEGAHHGHPLANVWMHNGFLQVEGEKMSKSAGNFFTIRELLADWPGEVLRFNMLKTHYRQPIDWTRQGLLAAFDEYYDFVDVAERYTSDAPDHEFVEFISDDLNVPKAMARLHALKAAEKGGDVAAGGALRASLEFIGLINETRDQVTTVPQVRNGASPVEILKAFASVMPRNLPIGHFLKSLQAPHTFNEFPEEVALVSTILKRGDLRTYVGDVERLCDDLVKLEGAIEARKAARANKDFAESDRIRDELLAKGIVLKDGPGGTTWEVKR